MSEQILTPTHPEFSVTEDVRPGDTLVVGGPGASFILDGMAEYEKVTDGDEVTILETRAGLVRFKVGGSFWSITRFSLPGTPVEEPYKFRVGDKIRTVVKSNYSDFTDRPGDVHTVTQAASKIGSEFSIKIDTREPHLPCVDARRFELVEAAQESPEMSAEDAVELAALMSRPTKVVLVPDDVIVAQIPTRSYDSTKGDRRFTRPDAAVEWAYGESVRTGVQHVVRRDPGSYDFQELTLVQRLGS